MGVDMAPDRCGMGVIGFYLLVAIELTSLSMRKLPKQLWRAVHTSSFVLFLLGTTHALQAGTDVANPLYKVGSLLVVQLMVFLVVMRLVASRRARRQARAHRSAPVPRVASSPERSAGAVVDRPGGGPPSSVPSGDPSPRGIGADPLGASR